MKKIFVVILAIVIVLTTSSLVFANEFIVTSNNKELIFTKGILYEEDMIYLPLEELLDLLLINESPDNFLRKNGDKFSLYIENDAYPDIYNMEINKKEIVYTQEPVTIAPATRETKHAPILRDGLIYIPFEFTEYIVPLEEYGLKWVNENTFKSAEVKRNYFFVFIVSITILSLLTGIYTLFRKNKAVGIIQLMMSGVCPIITMWFCSLKTVRAYGGTDWEFLIHSATVDGDVVSWVILFLFITEFALILKTTFSVLRDKK